MTNETYATSPAYPVQFSVDYPERPLNRVTTAFRIFVAIPILIVLGAVSGETWQWSTPDSGQMVVAGAQDLVREGLDVAGHAPWVRPRVRRHQGDAHRDQSTGRV